MSRAEYEWFMSHRTKKHCIMGNDYYIANEHIVHHDGSIEPSGEIFGYYPLTMQYYRRYHLPVMHTETNFEDPGAVGWLRKQWANAFRLKQDGIPLLGFTWYSLTDQVDWDTSMRENNGTVNKLGLYDLDRRIRPVGEAYKKLITMWKDVLSTESYGLHVGD
jgi:beta-glucosidase/6-phospho-beta-glucosidase/beta-galactosidase